MKPPPRCICADSSEDEGYREALGEERADLLLTDPPYCLLTRRRKGGDLRDPRPRKIDREPVVRFDTVRDYREFTREWMTAATRWLTSSAPLVIWTNLLGKAPIVQTASELGYGHLWGEFVWAKRTRDANINEQLLRVYEVALVLGRTPAASRALSDPPLCWSVVTGYDDEGSGDQWGAHPHHKPHTALAPLILTWSQPGSLILDPFAGSGSIPVSAIQLGRRTACIEKVPKWADLVTVRLQHGGGPSPEYQRPF